MAGVDNPILRTAVGARRCWAQKHGGEQCGGNAMKGTDPPRCRNHVGLRPAMVKAEQELKEQAAKVGARLARAGLIDIDENPLTRLQALAIENAKWKAYLREVVGDLDGLRFKAGNGENIRGEVKLYTEALDRCVKSDVELVRLGIEERLVRIDETQLVAMGAVLRIVLRKRGQDPTDAELQRDVREALLAVEAKQESLR